MWRRRFPNGRHQTPMGGLGGNWTARHRRLTSKSDPNERSAFENMESGMLQARSSISHVVGIPGGQATSPNGSRSDLPPWSQQEPRAIASMVRETWPRTPKQQLTRGPPHKMIPIRGLIDSFKECRSLYQVQSMEDVLLRSDGSFYCTSGNKVVRYPDDADQAQQLQLSRVFQKWPIDAMGLAACQRGKAFRVAKTQAQVSGQRSSNFLVSELYLLQQLVDKYLKFGDAAKTKQLFEELVEKLAAVANEPTDNGEVQEQQGSSPVFSQLIPPATTGLYLQSLLQLQESKQVLEFLRTHIRHLNPATFWYVNRVYALIGACGQARDPQTCFDLIQHMQNRESLPLDALVYQRAITLNLCLHENPSRGLSNALEMSKWMANQGLLLEPQAVGTMVMHMAKQGISRYEIIDWLNAQHVYNMTRLLLHLIPALLDHYKNVDLCIALLANVVNNGQKPRGDDGCFDRPNGEARDMLLRISIPKFLQANPTTDQVEKYVALMTRNGTKINDYKLFAALASYYIDTLDDQQQDGHVDVEMIVRKFLDFVDKNAAVFHGNVFACSKSLGSFLGTNAQRDDVSLVIEVIGRLFLNDIRACHEFADSMLWRLLARPGQIDFLNMFLQVLTPSGIGIRGNKIHAICTYYLDPQNHAISPSRPQPLLPHQLVDQFIEFIREFQELFRDLSWAMDAALEVCIRNQWLAECQMLIEATRYNDIAVSINTLQDVASFYFKMQSPASSLVDLTEVTIENPRKPIDEQRMVEFLEYLLEQGELYQIVDLDCRLRLARRFKNKTLRRIIWKANHTMERANAYWPKGEGDQVGGRPDERQMWLQDLGGSFDEDEEFKRRSTSIRAKPVNRK